MKFQLNKIDTTTLKKSLKENKELFRSVILIFLNDTNLKQKEIAEILDITPKTVSKIKKRYLEHGLDYALNDNPRSGQPRKYDNEKETEIITLACTDPPEGQKQWTVRLIAEKMREKPTAVNLRIF
jgi:transposase